MALSRRDYSREKIDFGLTEADLGPRIKPGAERALLDFPAMPAKRKLDVQSSWPEHWAPLPQELQHEPNTSDALPRADGGRDPTDPAVAGSEAPHVPRSARGAQ